MSIKITPNHLKGIIYPPLNLTCAASIIQSAIASKQNCVIEHLPVRDELLTIIENARNSGADITIIKEDDSPFIFSMHINGNGQINRIDCEADIYLSAPWLCCAALGCDVTISGINLKTEQSGIRFLNDIKEMGAIFERKLYGLQISASIRQGITIDASDHADFIPFIGVLACFTHGITCITHTIHTDPEQKHLLAETEKMLSCLGADAALINDSLMINGSDKLYGGIVNTKGDHRIMMAAAAAACKCENEVILSHPECIDNIYPAFWQDYNFLGGKTI